MTNGSVELTLFGQKIVLRHKAEGEADAAIVGEVMAIVSDKIKQAQSRAPKGSAPHHVTLLALMDLASEYLQAKSRTQEYQREMEAQSASLLTAIESWIDTGKA